ncbi:MAG: glutamate synthase large chain, partial [Blastocatellia bacterium]|nr:glutamate synthase large chain [Blastocatellia bacterium]
MKQRSPPRKQGLYDPLNEHESCGLGFVVDVKGRRSRRIVEQAIQVLLNLEHRGACGCEPNTGDGAGILLQIPHRFFARECENRKFKLPPAGQYAVGMVFLPKNGASRRECERLFERIVKEEGQRVLGWRTVRTNDAGLGPTARASKPVVRQIFIAAEKGGPPTKLSKDLAFERKLYVIRKRVSKGAKRGIFERGMFYVSSLSARTIVYKGMLTAGQLVSFYPDLADLSVESALALVHSRFSTNTFPS